MKHLTTLKILSATTLALAFTATATAGSIESLSQRVNCDSCCCDQLDLQQKYPPTIIKGGVDDNYQGGTSETTSPRAALVSYPTSSGYNSGRAGTTRDYDELHSNEYFLETLNVSNASAMKNGWLVFHLKSNGDRLDGNDNMYFGNFVDQVTEGAAAKASGSPADESKYRTFASRVNQFLTKTDSHGPIFQQDSATGAYYARLDRVKLISANHSGTDSLLDQIKQDGFMDMVIQDDTGIDYVAIIACFEGKSGTRPQQGKSGTRPQPRDFKRIQRR